MYAQFACPVGNLYVVIKCILHYKIYLHNCMPRPFGLPVEVKTCGLEMEMQDVFSNSISTPGNKK
jgi:hypothetical protein